MSATACGHDIDLATSLQVDAVTTGWFDAGIIEGKKKLVPAVSFTLKNASDQKLRVLQVNASFRRVGDPDEWGSAYLTAAGSGGSRSRRGHRCPHPALPARLHRRRIGSRNARQLLFRRRHGSISS